MSPYEIADLRHSHSMRAMEIIKFQLTVTFAVYAAGNYLGDQLNWVSAGALTIFFGLAMFGCYFQADMVERQIRALAKDVSKLAADADGLASLEQSVIDVPFFGIQAAKYMPVFVWAAFIPFLLTQ